jgi:hypothetical protein
MIIDVFRRLQGAGNSNNLVNHLLDTIKFQLVLIS